MLLRDSQAPRGFQGRRDCRSAQRVRPPEVAAIKLVILTASMAPGTQILTFHHHEATPFPRVLHGDDDLCSRVSLSEIPYRFGNLPQRKGPVDDGRDLPGINEFLQGNEIRVAVLRDEGDQLLPPEARHHGSQEEGQDRWLLAARLSGQ